MLLQMNLNLKVLLYKHKFRTAIPKNPSAYPRKMNKNLRILIEKLKDKSGIANEEIDVIETIIIKIGLTILAETAACPKIKAPTIPSVGPIGEGTLSPASRISSKENSIINISKIIGNGTDCLEATIAKRSSVGIIS